MLLALAIIVKSFILEVILDTKYVAKIIHRRHKKDSSKSEDSLLKT